jgi:hypothetical protein
MRVGRNEVAKSSIVEFFSLQRTKNKYTDCLVKMYVSRGSSISS